MLSECKESKHDNLLFVNQILRFGTRNSRSRLGTCEFRGNRLSKITPSWRALNKIVSSNPGIPRLFQRDEQAAIGAVCPAAKMRFKSGFKRLSLNINTRNYLVIIGRKVKFL